MNFLLSFLKAPVSMLNVEIKLKTILKTLNTEYQVTSKYFLVRLI